MNTTNRFWATIEYLPGQRAAIIELTDGHGEWAGGGRIDIRSSVRSDLYEEGYRHASRAAAAKGGTLDRFSEFVDRGPGVLPRYGSAVEPETCGQAVSGPLLRRPANALNIEAGAEPLTRCRLKLPDHWTGAGASSLRWLGSGGSPLVFGVCTPGNCPARKGSV